MEFTENDRKLITEHSVKLTQVCKKLDRLINKVDENAKTYITRRIFLSINGIIIGLLIILFGYTATINDQVVKNTVCIEKLEQK